MYARLSIALAMMLTAALPGCGNDPAAPGDPPVYDTTAPGVVDDLRVLAFDETAVTIEWTAPGDDGQSGTAIEYEIGYAASPISPASWANCSMLSPCPTPSLAGTPQSAVIEEPPSPDVYLALRTVDESGNWSDLSNVAHAHLSAATDWTSFDMSSGLPHEVVAGIAVDHDGTMWCAHPVEGGGGVSSFDGSAWRHHSTNDGLGSNAVLWFQAIAIDSGGDAWVGTWDRGVSRFDGESWTVYTSEDGLVSNLVIAVAAGPGGEIWCAGEGVSHFDGEVWTTYDCAEVGLPRYVYSVAVGPDGSVWAGGIGLRRFDGEAWIDYSDHHFYVTGPVTSIAFAPEGSMWVAGDGVSLFDGQNWTRFELRDMGLVFIDDQAITSISVGEDGSVWAATSNQGVVRYDGTTWTRYTTEHGLICNELFSVAVAPDGPVWFGTNAGASLYSGH